MPRTKPTRIGFPFINPSTVPRVYPSTARVPIRSFPITLKTQGPQETSPVERIFATPQALSSWVSAHKRATLKAFATPTERERIFSRSEYVLLDPKRTYGVYSPLHTEEIQEIRHNQISDTDFEDKCRLAMAKFFRERGVEVQEKSRVLYDALVPESYVAEQSDPDSPVASSLQHTTTFPGDTESEAIEWDGMWKDERGVYYLLECKHYMTAVFMPTILKLIEL